MYDLKFVLFPSTSSQIFHYRYAFQTIISGYYIDVYSTKCFDTQYKMIVKIIPFVQMTIFYKKINKVNVEF